MFFEPPSGRQREEPVFPDLPPWSGPPDAEIGVVLALQRVMARSDTAVVLVPTVRVYSTGCMVSVELTTRQGDLDPETWWDLHTAPLLSFPVAAAGGRLSDRVLRLGVRYPDGSKATTLDLPRWRGDDGPPPDLALSFSPFSSGGRRGVSVHTFGLWLWPLPPPEPVEFAVEWPIAGVDLTVVEIDGAAIRDAAARSQHYWPPGT